MKKLIKIVVIAVATILLLQGCSFIEYEYIKPKPYTFQVIEQPKKRTIRVYAKDIELYEAYIGNFRNIIDFQNSQILDYQKTFNETKAK